MNKRLEFPRLLAIGGSDSCGGAGIQADTKTGAAMGVDVSAVITAITAQNSVDVQAIWPVPLDVMVAQLTSVCSDIPPHAVKLGMLFDAPRVMAVGDAIRQYELHCVVCDPVLASTSGKSLLDADGVKALLSLLPLISLLTPNSMEAAALSGRNVENAADLVDAGRALLDLGAKAVLLKGGHLGGKESTDLLLQRDDSRSISFSAPRLETRNDHGTGCVLASSIAAGLALGRTLPGAVIAARAFVQKALESSAQAWNGQGRGGMQLLH